MVDGEETATVRGVRPATPPSEAPASTPAVPAPRPRPEPVAPPAPATATPTDAAGSDTAGRDAAAPDRTGPDTADATTASPSGPASGLSAAPIAPRRRRLRLPFTHAVRRMPPPREAVVATGRAVAAWSRRPSGRVTLPGVLLLVLIVTAGAAGAIVVPATAGDPRPVAADSEPHATGLAPDPAQPAPAAPGLPLEPAAGTPTAGPPVGSVTGGRPADVLAGWAQQLSARLGVSTVALQAYGYAELVLARTTPGCRLTWTTLAAIGKVESQHGTYGATLHPDGLATPQIVGPPLNGQGGTQLIGDTDRGEIDGDLIYDRAIGPMQFIPSTWREIGADADNDGTKNPNNLFDAALAAGNYLCKNGRNLTSAPDWWNAILSYNDVRPYAQEVFDTANDYGRRSRT